MRRIANWTIGFLLGGLICLPTPGSAQTKSSVPTQVIESDMTGTSCIVALVECEPD